MPSVFSVPAFGIGWVIAFAIIVIVSVSVSLIRHRNDEVDEIEETIEDRILLRVIVPATNEKTPEVMDGMLQAVHGIIGPRQRSFNHISLEISATSFGVEFYIVVPQQYKTLLESNIYSHYPFAEVHVVPDYVTGVSSMDALSIHTRIAELELTKDSLFPLKTYTDFQTDPLVSVIGSIGTLEAFELVGFQLLLRPVNNRWQRIIRDYVKTVNRGMNPQKRKNWQKVTKIAAKLYDGVFSIRELQVKDAHIIDKSDERELQAIHRKSEKQGYEFTIRLLTSAKTEERSNELLMNIVSALQQFSQYNLNSLKTYIEKETSLESLSEKITQYKTRFLSVETTDIINTQEAATIYHLPNSNFQLPTIHWMSGKKVEAPANLPESDCVIIGETDYRAHKRSFGIERADRRKHMYMLGKTGSGKTTLLKELIIQDILNGEGVGIIDPHGDLAQDILAYIPPERMQDVVIIDPSDRDFPVALNLFHSPDPSMREYTASTIIDVLKKHFDSWGPRLEYILHNTVLTLLHKEGTTFLSVQRILSDPLYRKTMLTGITDPVLLRFWYEEYAAMERNARLTVETISPIQNKIGRFLSSPIIRNCVSQAEGKIDFEDIVNNKKILICNLSQGKLGEDNAALLGSLIITKIQSCIMARVNIPEDMRNDFYLYIDEFQLFATPVFTKMLSEGRKYHLNLILAHQYIGQLSEQVHNAVFGNVGTMISFSLGAEDAKILEKEYFPVFTSSDFMTIEKYHIYIREMIDGVVAQPFSAGIVKKNFQKWGLQNEIISNVRKQYANPVHEVEEEIRQWHMQSHMYNRPMRPSESAQLGIEEHQQVSPNQRLVLK